jgi:anhydro-N-acetylmuramic acid kinase
MHILSELWNKPARLVIGLMSGTSADGIDAALTRISGCGMETSVELCSFLFIPFPAAVREKILYVAGGGGVDAAELCRLKTLLGQLYGEACLALCRQAGVGPDQVDLVGCHGQTVWHIPQPEEYLGRTLAGTLQIGEDALIAQAMGCPVVGDFRVRDMAAGGQGAPLVPYTEWLLYREAERTVALQNIGGIGNVTVLPAGCALEEVTAFDTGPGNMVMDALVRRLTGGERSYDEGGRLAAAGTVSRPLLAWMLSDPYLERNPPKTTGREVYGERYVRRLLAEAERMGVDLRDALATATRFTAEAVAVGLERFAPARPERLVVGGGGSWNETLLAHLRDCLPGCEVITNEELGLSSDAKEAVAFAILANEAVFGVCNNAPAATGAGAPVVMGKLSL